ncbi:hypothetical protein N9L68_02255 [bacterium]|nr:hypothetical protein [bacterium]
MALNCYLAAVIDALRSGQKNNNIHRIANAGEGGDITSQVGIVTPPTSSHIRGTNPTSTPKHPTPTNIKLISSTVGGHRKQVQPNPRHLRPIPQRQAHISVADLRRPLQRRGAAERKRTGQIRSALSPSSPRANVLKQVPPPKR